MKPIGSSSVTRVNYTEATATQVTWGRLHIPSYIWLVMLVVTTIALSLSTVMQAREQIHYAQVSYSRTAERVKQVQTENEQIRERIKALRENPRVIEQTTREHLHYLRPNEIAVKLR